METQPDPNSYDMTQITDFTSEYPELSELTESDRYSLLASERRRLVLDVLAGRTAPMSLNALAIAVAVHEADEESPPEGAVERATIELHHHHLPKMDELGLIDYDPDAKRIE